MAVKLFTNKDVADLLRRVSTVYTINDDSTFRIQAYERASVSIEHLNGEIKDIWEEGKLEEIPGVGKGIANYLDELLRTGKVKHFEKLFKKIPEAVFIFERIQGIGPKKAYSLATNLKITSGKDAVDKLKKAAKTEKIREIEGFGEASEIDILSGIEAYLRGETEEKRLLLFEADMMASEIIDYLKSNNDILEANPLGSLRRMLSTIGDIDISVSTNNPKSTIDHFVKYPKIKQVLSKGEETLVRVILFNGKQIDLRISKPESYGSMLQYFTGSKQHNINLRNYAIKKGLSLSEYGITLAQNAKRKTQNDSEKLKIFRDEVGFYNELGLQWIPPELREGGGEIAAAENKQLPNLVEVMDIKGDLHLHSDFSIEPSHDLGMSSIDVMVKTAIELKYEYLGFTEHNPSVSKHTKDNIINLLKRKKDFIEQYKYSQGNKLPIKILNGLEIDISPKGQLAIPDNGYQYIDYAIVSIHSSLDTPKEEMTKRVLSGLSNTKAKILGHPTGRLLGEREGYQLDWDLVFDFCVKNNKFIEISSWPNRLDLPDYLVKDAVKYNVKLIINTDSHEVSQMLFMKYGVSVARRGWAERKNIINTLPYKELAGILL